MPVPNICPSLASDFNNGSIGFILTKPTSGATPTGYRIKMGLSSGSYTITLDTASGGWTDEGTYLITVKNSIPNFTWYFVGLAYNGSGEGPATAEQSRTPLNTTDDADFVSQAIPSSISVNVPFTVSATFTNTGTSTWTEDNLYRLFPTGTLLAAVAHPPRLELGTGVSVSPGQNGTFSASITISTVPPDNYTLGWIPFQELHSEFGSGSTNQNITLYPETPTLFGSGELISNVPSIALSGS